MSCYSKGQQSLNTWHPSVSAGRGQGIRASHKAVERIHLVMPRHLLAAEHLKDLPVRWDPPHPTLAGCVSQVPSPNLSLCSQ